MYRVELKEGGFLKASIDNPLFLMYRVELKVAYFISVYVDIGRVPNVPCGVERTSRLAGSEQVKVLVPNVPCGVESKDLITAFSTSNCS